MKYGTILADPPWEYGGKTGERRGTINGAASKHYPCMTDQEIAALPVSEVAAADAVLLLWATWPKLDVALDVIRAWGFRYKTGFPWVKIMGHPQYFLDGSLHLKPKWGTGWWVRGCSEPLLICVRGNPRRPKSVDLGLLSNALQHSRKPENLYEYAEQLEGPYLEIFGRRRREGWDVFGNEVADSISLGAA